MSTVRGAGYRYFYVTGSSHVNISAIAQFKLTHNSELNGLSDKKRAELWEMQFFKYRLPI